MSKPIHEYNFWHGFLRSYVDIYLYTFYDKVTIVGKHNIPKDKPVIFAINHQNALMDALTTLCTLKGQVVFMARADIFQNKTVAKILRFFKILPIYRMRDGIKNLQNNDSVFEEAIEVLNDGHQLAILPEGNHFGERRLRDLKKGIARIAFTALDRNNFELDLQIVPVGLDYSHYINFGADLLVQFGEPFSINNYKDRYLENPQRAMNEFLQDLREKMIPQMLHIDDEQDYEALEALKNVYIHHLLAKRKIRQNHHHILKKSQEIVDYLLDLKQSKPEEFELLGKKALMLKDTVKSMNIRYWVPAHRHHYWIDIIGSYILLAILFPLFVFGAIINFLPFYLPVIATLKIKDPQFVSSVRFVVSIITFTFFYLTYIILLLIFVKPFLLALGLFVSIFLLGILSFRYYIGFKKVWAKTKVTYWKFTKNQQWKQLSDTWNEIVNGLAHYI